MNKILSLFLAACALSATFAANTKEGIESDLKFFKNNSGTTLKKGIANTDKFQSDAMKALADKMLSKDYKPEYLYAQYKAYPSPHFTGKSLKIGDGFSKYENMTGVYLDKGEHVILVGKTQDREIKLLLPNFMRKPAEGVEPTKDPNGWGLHKKEVPLKEGINIIQVDTPTNAYISYFADDYKKAPKIPVHFVTGKVNGYFDTTRGDTNKDWDKLLTNAVSPIMDARGKFIQVAYPVEYFKKFTTGQGVELINAYDKLVKSQYDFMGLTKYKKTPQNRVFARVNFNYYMFRDGDGVAYLGNEGTMRMVADPKVVVSGDPCWGFSHEVGHVMQMRPLTWGGMTEVSNNLYSLNASALMGNGSRLKDQDSYKKARANIIDKGVAHVAAGDVFHKLVPLWQLHLYFKKNGRPDFYADVMEYMRNNAKDYSHNDTIKHQFDYIKACCAVAKLDLTDFFEKWGFFKTGNFKVNDYAKYDFNITPEMVKETKDWIAAKKYKKPADDITLTDE